MSASPASAAAPASPDPSGAAPLATESHTDAAPASNVRVYRGALADSRGKIILAALALWFLAHLGVAGINSLLRNVVDLDAMRRPIPADAAIWYVPLDFQIGVAAFESYGGSFLTSVAWQAGALLCIAAAMVIVLTHRLRIIALLFPGALLCVAALFQCIAYNVHHPYWAQGNPLFTLALMGTCLVATHRLAPRNSGWPELRSMAREFAREVRRNPGGQIFGPIFAKEVRVMGRRRGTYWIRFLYPLGLLALVSLVYVSALANIDRWNGGAERIQRLQEIAPTLALFIAWAQYLMLLFLAAAFTSAAVCDERRTRTLASLMTTPMSATQIVMGKLTSRLVQLLIIGLVSVPFLMGIRVFGGLEAEVIIALVAITISSTFLMASLGILASVWSRKPAAAIALAVLLYMVVTLGPVLIIIIWSIRAGAGRPPDALFAFSSPMAMAGVTISITGGAGMFSLRELWVANSVVTVCVGLGAIFLAAVSLRSVMLSEAALEAPVRTKRRKDRRAPAPQAVAANGADPGTPADAPPTTPPEKTEVVVDRDTEVSDHPVLWRELRQPAVGSRRKLITAACIVVALILWLYTEVGPQEEPPHFIVGVIGMLLLIIQAAVASTPTITNEKDAMTWQTLLATPLTPAQILVPKFLGSLKKLWFVAAILGGEFLIGALAGGVHPVIFLHFAMIIVGVAVFLCGTGTYFSLVARRSNAAALLNMLLAGSLWIGLPLLGVMVGELILDPAFGGQNWALLDAIFFINPMAMAMMALQGSVEYAGGWNCNLPGGTSLGFFEYTAILAVTSGLGCAIGTGALWLARQRFNEVSGRTS